MINTAVTIEYAPFREFLHTHLNVERYPELATDTAWKHWPDSPLDMSFGARAKALGVVASDMIDTYLDNFVWCAGIAEELKDDDDAMVRFLYHLDRYVRETWPDYLPVLFYPLDLKGMLLVVIQKS